MRIQSLLLMLLLLNSGLMAQERVNYLNESEEAFQNRMQWFLDAKYGMFIHFGTYYSIIDWNHPSHDIPNTAEEIDSSHNRWMDLKLVEGKKAEYVQYMKNQIKELIEKYDTDILWFDGDWVGYWTLEDGNDLYQYCRELKPDVIINNRVSKRELFKKDFGTPEQEHPGETLNHYWEACYTMNDSWGFKIKDTDWKSPQVIYEKLQDITGKGGNFLLNVGPDGNGKVPKEAIEILLEVGKMIK